MDTQVPQHKHFKDSTRAILLPAQKLEIVDAAYRASDQLLSLCGPSDPGTKRLPLKYRIDTLFRAGSLIKGSLQPRHLYRRERQIEIWDNAWAIADETGGDVIKIQEYLIDLMYPYVSEDPY